MAFAGDESGGVEREGMTIWLVLQVLAAVPMVVLPFLMQARESWNPPMNTPSLGTFGIVMMSSLYFLVAGLINGGIVGVRLEWAWYGVGAAAVGAAAVGTLVAYQTLYVMAVRGGRGLTLAGGLVLGVMVAVNVVGPRLA